MKSLTDYLQTGSNVRIYESDNSLDELIKSGKPFIVTGDNFKKIKTPVFKAAQNNNCMFLTVYVDKMTDDDLKPITIDGQKILPDWAAHIIDNDSKCLVAFVFDDERDHSNLFNALMPIFLENKLFGKKYSHFIPCIVSTKELDLPKQLAKKLTPITV